MYTVVFMKESDTSHQSVKITFLNEPKQTEPTKQKHGVNMMHTTFVLPLTCHLPHHSQADALYFF